MSVVNPAQVKAYARSQLQRNKTDRLDAALIADFCRTQHPDLKRQRDLLTSIPGLGDLSAAKLLAEFRDIRHFQDVRQLVAFAGLNPQQRQSGSSVRDYPHLSNMGRASLRAALYMPALTAMRYNPILRAFADRLRQRGLRGKAVVTAVMRKLLHLIYGILKSGQPFDPDYVVKCSSTP